MISSSLRRGLRAHWHAQERAYRRRYVKRISVQLRCGGEDEVNRKGREAVPDFWEAGKYNGLLFVALVVTGVIALKLLGLADLNALQTLSTNEAVSLR